MGKSQRLERLLLRTYCQIHTYGPLILCCGVCVCACMSCAVQCKIVLRFPFLCLIVPIQARTQPFKAQTANTNTHSLARFEARRVNGREGEHERASESHAINTHIRPQYELNSDCCCWVCCFVVVLLYYISVCFPPYTLTRWKTLQILVFVPYVKNEFRHTA